MARPWSRSLMTADAKCRRVYYTCATVREGPAPALGTKRHSGSGSFSVRSFSRVGACVLRVCRAVRPVAVGHLLVRLGRGAYVVWTEIIRSLAFVDPRCRSALSLVVRVGFQRASRWSRLCSLAALDPISALSAPAAPPAARRFRFAARGPRRPFWF